ncbi:MAG: OmpA family protein [Bacteroidota bacterium]
MKKILFIGSLAVSSMFISQTNFNKVALDFDLGANKAIRRQGEVLKGGFPHIGLGARYNVTNLFGFKAGLSYDGFKNGKTDSLKITSNYIKLDLQGTMNFGNLFNITQWNKVGKKITFLGHMGPGIAFMTSPQRDGVLDKTLTLQTGMMFMYKVNSKLAIWGDAVNVLNIQGDWGYDMKLSTLKDRGIDKAHMNVGVGVSYYLGDMAEHADWTPNQTGDAEAMAALKAKVEAAEKAMMDDDKDGVPNYLDQEPGTAASANVDTKGRTVKVEKVVDMDGDGVLDVNDFCPTIKGSASANGCPDKDGDNIYDFVDKCPNAAGLAADGGCPVVTQKAKETMTKAMAGVQFDNGKATLIKKSTPILDEVAKVMLANPSYNLAVNGHTDNAGDPAKNLQLSEDRAKAVKAYLMSKGVAEGRLVAKGFGDTQPKASNATAKGKAANRRVEFLVSFEQ